MRQQSTTSTYTHWCVNILQQVHIEQHEPLKHGVNAYDPKEEAWRISKYDVDCVDGSVGMM
jgi:hypothetical protein